MKLSLLYYVQSLCHNRYKNSNFYRELFGLRAAQLNQQVVVTGGRVSLDQSESRKEVLCNSNQVHSTTFGHTRA